MPRHRDYTSYKLDSCKCRNWRVNPRWFARPVFDSAYNVVENEEIEMILPDEQTVKIACVPCMTDLATFHRDAVLDKTRGEETFVVGDKIAASRVVAWVGYAVDRGIMPVSRKAMLEEAARLMSSLGIDGPGVVDGLATSSLRVENRTGRFRARLTRLLASEALYNIFGNAMAKAPRHRSLWLQDREVETMITHVFPCYTGLYYAGSDGGYYDDYDYPGLASPVYQRLYACEDADGRFLIHPDDAREMVHA